MFIISRESCFTFWNMSLSFFPKKQVILEAREQRLIKSEGPFLDEISGFIIVKILDRRHKVHWYLKIRFVRNEAILDVGNGSLETLLFNTKKMLGILNLWL